MPLDAVDAISVISSGRAMVYTIANLAKGLSSMHSNEFFMQPPQGPLFVIIDTLRQLQSHFFLSPDSVSGLQPYSTDQQKQFIDTLQVFLEFNQQAFNALIQKANTKQINMKYLHDKIAFAIGPYKIQVNKFFEGLSVSCPDFKDEYDAKTSALNAVLTEAYQLFLMHMQ